MDSGHHSPPLRGGALHNNSGTVHKRHKRGLRGAQKRICLCFLSPFLCLLWSGSRFAVQSRQEGNIATVLLFLVLATSACYAQTYTQRGFLETQSTFYPQE